MRKLQCCQICVQAADCTPGAAYCSKLRRQPKVLSAHFALMQCVRNRAISDTVAIHVKLRKAVLSGILNSRESDEKCMSDPAFLPKPRVNSFPKFIIAYLLKSDRQIVIRYAIAM